METGDPLIDKWERELAEGGVPDYMEAFSEEQLKKLENLRNKGVDRFGKRVPNTFLDTSNEIRKDVARQGQKHDAGDFEAYKRFFDLDSPE